MISEVAKLKYCVVSVAILPVTLTQFYREYCSIRIDWKNLVPNAHFATRTNITMGYNF